MAAVKTTNLNTAQNSYTGGAVRVTCASNVGQGNDGTSLPCRMCWVSAPTANTAPTKVNIDIAASATLGVTICEDDVGQPLMIPIDDVSKLYFYSGGATDSIDIMYVL